MDRPAGHLVLAGGGHTHALLLKRWAMGRGHPPAAGSVSLVSRHSTALYSGMVPGVVAGHYAPEEAAIDLRQLCQQAGVTFMQAEITGLETSGRRLFLQGRPPLRWDWLSLDVGAVTGPEQGGGGGASEGSSAAQPGAMGVKPLEPFLAWLEQRLTREPPRTPLRIRGGGAAAVELALALRRRGLAVHLLLRGPGIRLGSAAADRLGERLLHRAGVTLRRQVEASAAADLACTGSLGPPWLALSGLPTDAHGRVLCEPSLQVLGEPRLFACGDCGVIASDPRPPSGVWAVRAAPTLAVNLERCLSAGAASGDAGGSEGAPPALRRWRPQRWALQLLGAGGSGGPPRAIALWGPLALGPSRLLWRWKDRIDRRFMKGFQILAMATPSQAMACRGCAAKLPAAPLMAALAESGQGGGAEDAATVASTPEGLLLQSVDGFPALVGDAWLNARLTTLHACGDLWASGARLHSALAIVTLPQAPEAWQQQLLQQTLAGIRRELEPHGAPLLGGHTLEARDGGGLVVTLSVNGTVAEEDLWRKGPLRPGDALLLSRPLGTGVLFAAAMAGAGRPAWIDAALAQMLQGQEPLLPLLRRHGCHACTDVTGFGLLGHLGEMLAASAPDLRLELHGAAVPALPGALELLAAGHASTLAPSNASALGLLQGPVVLRGGAGRERLALLIDPQTCGPMLAALPGERAAAALQQLHQAGFTEAALVGRVLTEGGPPGQGLEE